MQRILFIIPIIRLQLTRRECKIARIISNAASFEDEKKMKANVKIVIKILQQDTDNVVIIDSGEKNRQIFIFHILKYTPLFR